MPRRGLTTDQIVDAAAVMADKGLATVTFASLAAQLGVRPPSLYNHISSRAELLRLISLRGATELIDALTTASVGRSGDEALRATAHAYRAYALAHPGLYEATLAAPSPDDPKLAAVAERLIGLMAAVLQEWRLEGDDLIDAIRVIRSGLHGFVALERQGGFAMARDLDASYERLITTLTAGLRG